MNSASNSGAAEPIGTELRISREGPIAHAKLTSPDGHNRLNSKVLRQIEEFALSLRHDIDTKAVVFLSEGPNFSVGFDLDPKYFEANSDKTLLEHRRETEQGRHTLRAIRDIPAVTIAALHGVAAGGGACLATACDFRVASDTARIGFPEVKFGLNLMWGSLPLCVRLVGPARAKRLVMKGALEKAPLLENWGLIDYLVPDGEVAPTAQTLAEEYAALPPYAVQVIKKSIDAVSDAMDGAIMHMDTDQFLVAASSQDSRDARADFIKRRRRKER